MKLKFPSVPKRIFKLKPRPRTIIPASDAKSDELYWTQQSSDPAKQYLCRVIGRSERLTDKIEVMAYFPKLRKWVSIDVPLDYKLKVHTQLSYRKPPT